MVAVALLTASCVQSGGVEGARVEPGASSAPGADASPGAVSLRDDFERTVEDGWGGAGDARWDYVATAGEALDLSVSGGRAHAAAPAGVNKGNVLFGPPLAGDTTARATFAIELVPRRGEANHPQVLLRSDGMRTYYAFLLFPRPDKPAIVTIFSAKHDRYRTLAETDAPFVVEEGRSYALEGRARDPDGDVALELRAWDASEPRPEEPLVTALDRGPGAIRGGRAGVRLSFYAGPSSMTVDDFVAAAEAPAGE